MKIGQEHGERCNRDVMENGRAFPCFGTMRACVQLDGKPMCQREKPCKRCIDLRCLCDSCGAMEENYH